jgi:hypothetical protein
MIILSPLEVNAYRAPNLRPVGQYDHTPCCDAIDLLAVMGQFDLTSRIILSVGDAVAERIELGISFSGLTRT